MLLPYHHIVDRVRGLQAVFVIVLFFVLLINDRGHEFKLAHSIFLSLSFVDLRKFKQNTHKDLHDDYLTC